MALGQAPKFATQGKANESEATLIAAPPSTAVELDSPPIPTAMWVPEWPAVVLRREPYLPAELEATPKKQDPPPAQQESISEPAAKNVEPTTTDVKVSSAIALVAAWLFAFAMAGLAYLREGPELLPTVKSAIIRPPLPPAPIVQTHRTEDIELPAPRPARPRRSR